MVKGKMKGPGKLAHTATTKRGMGDSYGVGVRNPVGSAKVIMGEAVKSPKKIGNKTMEKSKKTLA